MELPSDPSPEQLEVLAAYLKKAAKDKSASGYGKKNYYKNRQEIIGKKLIIFQNSQTNNNFWYMRFYVGNKKYKTLSLRTDNNKAAIEKALEKWRSLQNHLDGGGEVFEVKTQQTIDQYMNYLEELLSTEQLKKHTIQGKKTSIKKLRSFLEFYDKPSDIPANVFANYIVWRRTRNWDRSHHKNNNQPPSEQTINKELCDFKGYFEWCHSKKIVVQDIEYPFVKIDWSKSIEKNPAFELNDWKLIVYYLRTWVKKTTNAKGNDLKNPFYRLVFAEFLKVQANSGLRPHEALLLKWSDVEIRSKIEVSSSDPDKKRERFIAHIHVSPDTKTGRRLVICPAGIYFKRLHGLYREKEGRSPKPNEYIFRNIGTVHSKADRYVGMPLNDTFFRKMWYELRDMVQEEKDLIFSNNYTLYSCRSFFINQRLEMGVPPAIVGELVGHSIKTMERFYKNIRLKQLEPELVQVRRNQLSEVDFQTFDLD